MKKQAFGCLLFMLIVCLMPIQVNAQEKDDTQSVHTSTILIEQGTGEILYKDNEHERLAPASMTKLMSLLLIMEALENKQITLDEMVHVSANAASMGGTQVFLEKGEEMSVDDLIKAIAIASANDATVAMAEEIAGSEKEFVKAMNAKAKSLSLKNTQFKNASGLPAEDHYSSAYDMALIAKELLTYESITSYTSTYEDYLRKGKENEFWLVNTNKLVTFVDEVDGLKTGYTSEAKYCLTASAKKDGMRLIGVVMGAETAKARNKQMMDLFDEGYTNYELEEIFAANETVQTYENFYSEKMTYDVVTKQPISIIHKKQEKKKDLTIDVILHEETLPLPILENTEVGLLQVKERGEVVQEHPLILKERANRATLLQVMVRLWKSVILLDVI